MAAGVFNIAKGAAAQLLRDNADSVVVLLLQENETEDTLVNYANVEDMLGEEGNVEADFSNYARKTGVTETITVDNDNNEVRLDIPDQTWIEAGNGTNNTLTKVVVAVQTGADDTTLIPLTHHDFPIETDGTNLTAQVHEDGFYRAS